MGYPTPEQAAPVVDVLVAVVEQLRRIADRLAAPSPAAGTCDASLSGGVFGTNFIGPCVLRWQHDGPVHQGANGAQWSRRGAAEEDLRVEIKHLRAAFDKTSQWHNDAETRLNLCRTALLADGYFTADEIGSDIAPRITELAVHLRAELAHEREQREDLRQRLKATSDACNDATNAIFYAKQAAHIADAEDVTDWQRGYRACSEKVIAALGRAEASADTTPPIEEQPACQRCKGRKVVPDWSNWDAYHDEPKPKPCPDCAVPDHVITVAGTLTEAEFEAVRAAGPPPPGEVVTADMVREALRRADTQSTCTATLVTFTETYRCAKPAGHYSDVDGSRDWHRDRPVAADGALPEVDDAMTWVDWAEGATCHEADRCTATKVTPERGTVRCMHPAHDATYHTGPIDGDAFSRWSWHDDEDGATPHTDTPKEP